MSEGVLPSRGGAPQLGQFIWGLMLQNLKFGLASILPMQPISGAPRCALRISPGIMFNIMQRFIAGLQRDKSCRKRRACVD